MAAPTTADACTLTASLPDGSADPHSGVRRSPPAPRASRREGGRARRGSACVGHGVQGGWGPPTGPSVGGQVPSPTKCCVRSGINDQGKVGAPRSPHPGSSASPVLSPRALQSFRHRTSLEEGSRRVKTCEPLASGSERMALGFGFSPGGIGSTTWASTRSRSPVVWISFPRRIASRVS